MDYLPLWPPLVPTPANNNAVLSADQNDNLPNWPPLVPTPANNNSTSVLSTDQNDNLPNWPPLVPTPAKINTTPKPSAGQNDNLPNWPPLVPTPANINTTPRPSAGQNGNGTAAGITVRLTPSVGPAAMSANNSATPTSSHAQSNGAMPGLSGTQSNSDSASTALPPGTVNHYHHMIVSPTNIFLSRVDRLQARINELNQSNHNDTVTYHERVNNLHTRIHNLHLSVHRANLGTTPNNDALISQINNLNTRINALHMRIHFPVPDDISNRDPWALEPSYREFMGRPAYPGSLIWPPPADEIHGMIPAEGMTFAALYEALNPPWGRALRCMEALHKLLENVRRATYSEEGRLYRRESIIEADELDELDVAGFVRTRQWPG